MAKRVHGFGTPLDCEVEAFLRRISDSPAAHIKAYSVERNNGAPHMITVQFIADAGFDAPAEQPQEGSEPQSSLGAHLAGLAGDSVFTKSDPQRD